MVDVSSQNNSVSINVSSSGTSANIKATADTAQYYSEKSREWAISNRIVDGVDYSSKYYAGKANESASNAQGFAQTSQDTYNQFQQFVDGALSNIDNTVQIAITDINTKSNEVITEINNSKTTILNDIEFIADGEKKEIGELIDTGKDELKEAIGDVKILTTLEIGDIGFTQMAIDESKGKRRILNGQLLIQEQYPQFTQIIKDSVALNPDLACTEDEWQTALTKSANGVCEKFVIDDEAGTIRLPKYPEYLDLTNNTSGASATSATVSVYGTGKTLNFIGKLSEANSTGYGTVLGNSAIWAAGGGYNVSLNSSSFKTVSTYNPGPNNFTNLTAIGVNTNGSKSGLTGKVTIPAVAGVTSEKIKGTYFIQVATGSETEDNIVNEIELNNPFTLLESKYSESLLNNASWLLSEGQWNAGSVYVSVYELLLKIYNGTETREGISVKLVTEEYTDYDFVLNTDDETFRLPLKTKLASGNAVVGNGITLGLTNGTNNVGLQNGAYTANNTLFAINNYGNPVGSAYSSVGDGISETSLGVTTDPTKSGLELSDSDLYLYFYVGETVQNANLVNIGRIQEAMASFIPNNSKSWDGQWVNCEYVVAQKVACPNSNLAYDMSSILPNDGYIYEVLFDVTGATGSTSGNRAGIAVTSDVLWVGESKNGFNVASAQTRSASAVAFASSFTIPIGIGRTLTLLNPVGTNTGTFTLTARMYRRIGTNL